MPRSRILILLLLVIVIIAGVAFVLMSGVLDSGDTTDNGDGGGVAAVPSEPSATPEPTETPPPTQALTDIVIAVQNISRGALIRPEAVALRPWPLEAVPFNGVMGVEDVIGMRARTDIYVEQPILTSMVVPGLDDLASVGSDVSAIIPSGRVAIAVPMDRLTSVARGIQPGDYVDIIVSMLFVDIDDEFQSALPNTVNTLNIVADENGNLILAPGPDLDGRFESERIPYPVFSVTTYTAQQIPVDWPVIVGPSEAPRPRLVTQSTIKSALVLWVGDFPPNGRLFQDSTPTPEPSPTAEGPAQPAAQAGTAVATPLVTVPDLVTLAVTAQEAVMLTYMMEAHIPITFALRSASDTSQIQTESVTLDYIMSAYNISVPVRQGFGLEPAIRSIRQVILESTIQIGD